MGNAAKTREPWTFPAWMEPYRAYIERLAGGNPIEELMNDDGRNSNVFNNAPRALICVSVKSTVHTLERMHHDGVLA